MSLTYCTVVFPAARITGLRESLATIIAWLGSYPLRMSNSAWQRHCDAVGRHTPVAPQVKVARSKRCVTALTAAPVLPPEVPSSSMLQPHRASPRTTHAVRAFAIRETSCPGGARQTVDSPWVGSNPAPAKENYEAARHD